MVHVQNDVQPCIIGIVHDLLDTCHPRSIDGAVCGHVFAPGDWDSHRIESGFLHSFDHCLSGLGIAPAGFSIAGICVVAVQRVAQIPAHLDVVHDLCTGHGVDLILGGNLTGLDSNFPAGGFGCVRFRRGLGGSSGAVTIANADLVQRDARLIAPPVPQRNLSALVDLRLDLIRHDPSQREIRGICKYAHIGRLVPALVRGAICAFLDGNAKSTGEFAQ